MKYLSIFQIIELHEQLIEQSGGTHGIRDFNGLESAIAQPEMTFGGEYLYPEVTQKAAALAYSLCMNHPFVDGNKRVAHAAMEIFLVLNGYEIKASIDEQERLFFDLANGRLFREELVAWLEGNIVPVSKN